MEPSSPTPQPPEGAAREWLEQERQRAERSKYFYGTAAGKRNRGDASSVKSKIKWSTHTKVWIAITLGYKFLLTQFFDRGTSFAMGLGILLLYYYAHRKYRAYRLRGRANQADALKGITSNE